MTIKTFDTEGVLIIANTTKCKKYFAEHEFNYSYPKGLFDLIAKGIIHIITTEETVENLNFVFDEASIDLNRWEYNESYNYLDISIADEIRLIDHATFTQMCDSYNGDLDMRIESSLKTRKLINADVSIERETFEERYPKINLPVGLNKINVYSNTVAGENFLPEFTFLFELVENIDLKKITLDPLEIEG
ncbi:hypothetical protein OF897_04670 [Chryseobacterium formosus]|uniref:Uncharacterized protein n=1 Tax=Chryseobacterium formosus TaxID=1537363 RepID=A0ABT3XNJ0_9FLAO|nr:hypothetical protein [Chryseobacterium formosus]MCX8523216.1 hypothetical protein [Chryseobacterium formosus]